MQRKWLDERTKTEQCSPYVLGESCVWLKWKPATRHPDDIKGRVEMLRTFVEEAASLASIVLFVGMIAIWAQLITQL